ncbi:MAG: valine--tRNA ligase [Candidatus Omnitrophica bacterium CG11_big_fil_rev_8_21_14_0_20_42_13]|uniref:Valine--tRNA ligase n=1 Tax=Candidatus Ghiorseimicrobium undicola TaxID=1974746 RepID=A0A2H0LZD5_9BACT|nr:MAG: valine--tRNA ligase [Candidatus Omnitrophica bacterium CG11_big_fil_rev_8_21_14_0_20_42_13]
MNQMPPRYNPKETEDKWYKFWHDNNYFSAKINTAKKPFSIVIPPPNITGILHMGHALNNTIQDILLRYKRMQCYEPLWMPGTDHAGIATQNVVERKLAKEGIKRQDLGRDKFLEEVWKWRDEYGSTIINQLKKLGSSCDWQRMRFTMDEEYSEAVKEVFVALWDKGLIYQGNRIINWCPRCQTALSDEEAPYKDLEGQLYYIRYPLKEIKNQKSKIKNKEKNHIVVATTRPETMLGDTAVAVNPKDKRYKQLIGESVILPLMEREIKIIADSFVDPKFGTGAVKVTPAHDPNDYEIGLRHNLDVVNIMDEGGVLNINAGDYQGMDRFEAREAIINDLTERKLIEKIEPHAHSVGHCYRCSTVIEPYLSKQWFVNMKPLAKPAIEAVKKGEIKFYPKRWTKIYLNWMENIRDWCISRQIWWGHRIPVYYCRNCQAGMKYQIPNYKLQINSNDKIQNSRQKNGIIVAKARPEKCPDCASTDIYQDEDVLDTWFSSWLWPFATFRDKAELNYFYPTSVLVTAQEIIFFWVARMIMAGFEFMGKKPFSDVYIHGTVRDDTGKKMSKSLGNIIDPLEIINEFGSDALRFSIISLTSVGQDIYLSKNKFEYGRNFANKVWNASRYIIMNLKPEELSVDLCIYGKSISGLAEKWILSRFYETLAKIEKALDNYKINEAAKTIYEFFWNNFCDWYIEFSKLTIANNETQVVLYKVLEKTLRIMHPFLPHLTEEIWSNLPGAGGSIMIKPWPHMQKNFISKAIDSQMRIIIDLISSLRNARSEWHVPDNSRIDCILKIKDKSARKTLEENQLYIKKLAGVANIKFSDDLKDASGCVSGVIEKVDFYIPLGDVVDLEKEKARLNKQLEASKQQLKGLSARLKNKEFLAKAPRDVVEKEKQRAQQLNLLIKRIKINLSQVSS